MGWFNKKNKEIKKETQELQKEITNLGIKLEELPVEKDFKLTIEIPNITKEEQEQIEEQLKKIFNENPLLKPKELIIRNELIDPTALAELDVTDSTIEKAVINLKITSYEYLKQTSYVHLRHELTHYFDIKLIKTIQKTIHELIKKLSSNNSDRFFTQGVKSIINFIENLRTEGLARFNNKSEYNIEKDDVTDLKKGLKLITNQGVSISNTRFTGADELQKESYKLGGYMFSVIMLYLLKVNLGLTKAISLNNKQKEFIKKMDIDQLINENNQIIINKIKINNKTELINLLNNLNVHGEISISMPSTAGQWMTEFIKHSNDLTILPFLNLHDQSAESIGLPADLRMPDADFYKNLLEIINDKLNKKLKAFS